MASSHQEKRKGGQRRAWLEDGEKEKGGTERRRCKPVVGNESAKGNLIWECGLGRVRWNLGSSKKRAHLSRKKRGPKNGGAKREDEEEFPTHKGKRRCVVNSD